MRPIIAGLALLCALATAQAQPNLKAKPGPDEIAAIKTCVAEAVRNKTNVQSCAGKAVDLCVERQLEDAVFDCQVRELAVWDVMLNGGYDALKRGLDRKPFAHLRDVQRAWVAYVEKKCMLSYVLLNSGSTGAVKAEFACRLEETARRVAELQGLQDWLDARKPRSGPGAKP